jgi:hypothetical protein
MGEVIDFQEEKRKRLLKNPLDFPNEGVVPLNERMMNAVHKVDQNIYHQAAIEKEREDNDE